MSESNGTTKVVGTRAQDEVDAKTKQLSSQILDLIAIKGKVDGTGPGVGECGGDPEKQYLIRHSWSISGSTDAEVSKAMTRLKDGLPAQGWKIVQYGRNNSAAKSLELTADHTEKKFGVNVEFWEKGAIRKDNPPALVVTVVSGCYQVPDGQTVKHY
ncbi:hypothetical protein ACFYXH_02190 [Streptomyces sp. NPDC002730]|uniref:hypothetical protein n=1 Tax=Streptomyces sp. NPDC002730 TaxID=3364662 RepID=UPI0036B2CD7F